MEFSGSIDTTLTFIRYEIRELHAIYFRYLPIDIYVHSSSQRVNDTSRFLDDIFAIDNSEFEKQKFLNPRVKDLQRPRLGNPHRGLQICDTRVNFPVPLQSRGRFL